jgi:hypothetical protein
LNELISNKTVTTNYAEAFKDIEFQIIYQLKTDMFELFLNSKEFEVLLAKAAMDRYPNLKSQAKSRPSSPVDPVSPRGYLTVFMADTLRKKKPTDDHSNNEEQTPDLQRKIAEQEQEIN